MSNPLNLVGPVSRLLTRTLQSLLDPARPNGFAGPLETVRPVKPSSDNASHGESSNPAVPYPGDFTADITAVHFDYEPQPNGRADPGEVVWAWVPFEEDHRRGKDRPVVVLAEHGGYLLAVPMTSKDHERDAAQEAAAGRHWLELGRGSWDSRGRPSEVRLDRILQLDPQAVRREGARLDPDVFHQVTQAVLRQRKAS